MSKIKQFPHCDPRILHAPNECIYCDKHPKWQQLREVWGINFTGENDVTKSKCPAEQARELNTIELWGGNVPYKKEEELPKKCTLSGRPVEEVRAEQTEEFGQHKDYIVLCPDERAKGFIRPYRDKYIHAGRLVKRHKDGRLYGRLISRKEEGFPFDASRKEDVAYVDYHGMDVSAHGRYIEKQEFDAIISRKTHFGGCGALTRMGKELSETWARDLKFYSHTFCFSCNKHLPVQEFVWEDGSVLGT